MMVPGAAQLSIIAVIAALIFGTKKLRAFGGDLGGMFKGIKDGFREAAGAAEEIGPELRELKKDVQSIKAAGKELTFRSVHHDRGPVVIYGDGEYDDEEDLR